MPVYETLLWFHVTFAVLWVGGVVLLNLLAFMAQQSNSDEQLAYIGRKAEVLGLRYFTPIALLVVLGGAGLTLEGPWQFGDAWISASLGMYLVSFLLGAVYLGPRGGTIGKAIEAAGGRVTADVRPALDRLLLIARLDAVILLGVVFLMTTKPGS